MSVRVRFPSEAHESLLEEIPRGIFCVVTYLGTLTLYLCSKQFVMQKKRAREDFEKAAAQSLSIAGMCRYFGLTPSGGNYRIMHNAILKYGIVTSHFTGQGWNTNLKFKPFKEKPINEILVKDSSFQSHKLKRRLLSEGIKGHICESCGLSEWQGRAIPREYCP